MGYIQEQPKPLFIYLRRTCARPGTLSLVGLATILQVAAGSAMTLKLSIPPGSGFESSSLPTAAIGHGREDVGKLR